MNHLKELLDDNTRLDFERIKGKDPIIWNDGLDKELKNMN